MSAMVYQITSYTIVCSPVSSGANQRKHQSTASLAHVRGIHRGPVNSPHKGPVTRKMFPFDDVIMITPCVVIPPINGVRKFQPDSQCNSFYFVRMSELIKATDVWPVVIAANVVMIEREIVVISSTKKFAEPNFLCVSNQWTCLLDRQYLESVNKRVQAYNWFVSVLVSATHTRTHSDVWIFMSNLCDVNNIPLSGKKTK